MKLWAAKSLVAMLFSIAVVHAQAPSQGAAPQPASKWTAKDGWVTLHDFKFGTGGTLPDLSLHYLTLGEPHRSAGGRVEKDVLLLHGTCGNALFNLNALI